jgi:peptidyl-prolyl cis-trans isomerase C
LSRTKLKKQISTRENVAAAFADAAAEHSSCPQLRTIPLFSITDTFHYCDLISGGSLGSFGPRQMVPEFDKVVFSEAVGVIHGPIKTQFGAHLILIESRDD